MTTTKGNNVGQAVGVTPRPCDARKLAESINASVADLTLCVVMGGDEYAVEKVAAVTDDLVVVELDAAPVRYELGEEHGE